GGVNVPGTASRISDGNGINPWHVGNGGQIYRWDGSAQWYPVGQTNASDIGVSSQDVAWHVGADGSIYYWNAGAGNWVLVAGSAEFIAVDPKGMPWHV